MYAVFKVQCWLIFYQPFKKKISFLLKSLVKPASILIRISPAFLFLIWRPPALPHRLQCSTIGRLGLNRRVRDGNGCVPQPHRHRKYQNLLKSESFLIGSPKSFAFSRSRLRRLCSQSHQSAPESKLSSLLSDPVRAITHDSRRFNSI